MSTTVRRVVTMCIVGAMMVTLTGERTSASVAQKQHGFILRVGLIFPFTGDLSTYGPSLDKSAILAADLVNKALKRDHIGNVSIRIVGSEDDQTSPSAGVEAAKKLVDVDHAQVLIGSMSSGVTLAIAESVSIPDGVIQITPTSSDPSLTYLKNKDHWLWRVYPSDTLQGAALTEAMGRALGRHATINVGARNDAFGTALAAVFERTWRARGGKIGKVVIYNPNATTFDADAQQLASGNPKGWMIADFPPTFAKIGPALVRTGSWAPSRTFMTEAMDDSQALAKIGGLATDGLRGTAGSAPKGASAANFEALFKKTYPTFTYTGFEGTSFDAVVLAALAAVRAGTSNPAKVKLQLQPVSAPPGTNFSWRQLPEAFKAVRGGHDINYQGAWGPIDWDARGDPTTSTYAVWQYKNGKIKNIATFVFHSKRK